MRCPTLSELPQPPIEKFGWPWTVESKQLPNRMPNGDPWPKISIITPSFNQGVYIEETIRSILLQGYPNFEYVIMDGGSTDGTVEIIKKYENWISHWVSEKDDGQADAINKGLQFIDGEIFQFINSDDFLSIDCMKIVSEVFLKEKDVHAVATSVRDFSSEVDQVTPNFSLSAHGLLREVIDRESCRYHQPGIWLLTNKVKELGFYDARLHYLFDFELFVRYFEKWGNVKYVNDILSNFRLHPSSKTISQSVKFEEEHILSRLSLAKNLINPGNKSLALTIARILVAQKGVTEIQESLKLPFLIKLLKMLVFALRNPHCLSMRFYWGGLKSIFFNR